METELADLDGLDKMTATAAENYANIILEFEFGWDKAATLAEVRDAMNTAEAAFPEGAEKYSLNEFNFSEFPIIIVNLTGAVPERTMARVAKELQDDLESLDPILEAGIAGSRDEMVEVIIDPLRLEAYNVTAGELINVVVNNNQLIAAGEVETESGTFSVKIPSSFDEARDIYQLPVKTNGDRVVTLGDLAEINFTFEDRGGTARFNGEKTVALQVVKRKGYNLIDTVDLVKSTLEKSQKKWPKELQAALKVGTSNDQSRVVNSMVSQLEGSVLTAIALVMIVVLSALGSRAALLVGFAIPTSFLLCFALLALMGVSISNIVMFGLILAVGMLVDGAIVIVEYADKRIKEGSGPMHAYVEAAKRMFWPVVSSTATTLCAFLPMLFWPGVPGEFMGMLPVTLIFVLSASLVVALVYLPVMGGVTGRISRVFGNMSDALRARMPWIIRAALVPVVLYGMFLAAMQVLNPHYLLPPETGAVVGSLAQCLKAGLTTRQPPTILLWPVIVIVHTHRIGLVPDPERIEQRLPPKCDQVRLSGLQRFFRLWPVQDHANALCRNPSLGSDMRGIVQLVPFWQSAPGAHLGAALVAARGTVDHINPDCLQLPGQHHTVFQLPPTGEPIHRRHPEEQWLACGPDRAHGLCQLDRQSHTACPVAAIFIAARV